MPHLSHLFKTARLVAAMQAVTLVLPAGYALLVLGEYLGRSVGVLDEAMVLVGAMLVRRGAGVHVDFYSVYPPGNYQPTAWAFSLLGENLLAARSVHCLLYMVLLASLGRWFYREGARGLLLTGLLLATVALTCGLPMYPSFLGVTLALLAVIAYLEGVSIEAARSRVAALLAAGTCAGLALTTRLNFGLYVVAVFAADQLLFALKKQNDATDRLRWVRDSAYIALPVVFCTIGLALVLRENFGAMLEQSAGITTRALREYSLQTHNLELSGRSLLRLMSTGLWLLAVPFLWLGLRAQGRRQSAWFGAAILLFLVEAWVGAKLPAALPLLLWPVILALLGNQLTVWAIDRGEFIALLTGSLFAHYYLSRPDFAHQFPSSAPVALLLPSLCALRGPSWPKVLLPVAGWLLLLEIAWPMVRFTLPTGPSLSTTVAALGEGMLTGSDSERIATTSSPLKPPLASFYNDDDEARAARYVRARTRDDEPVYVGLKDHARLYTNNVRIYWLLTRWPGARHYMLLSGLTNTDSAAREMIGDLKARRVRWVIRYPGKKGGERFETQQAFVGSRLLDRYLETHYQLVTRFGSYEVSRLRSGFDDAL